MEKKTINSWMFELNVRPAIHDEKLYEDENLYTIEEFLEKVPYNTQVPLFKEENGTNEIVKVENGEITVVEEVVNKIVEFEKEKLKMDLIEKDLKEKLKEAMENNNVTKLEFGELKVSYRNASTRTTVDSKKLKEDLPDIYEEYSKTSNVSSSISISVE